MVWQRRGDREAFYRLLGDAHCCKDNDLVWSKRLKGLGGDIKDIISQKVFRLFGGDEGFRKSIVLHLTYCKLLHKNLIEEYDWPSRNLRELTIQHLFTAN